MKKVACVECGEQGPVSTNPWFGWGAITLNAASGKDSVGAFELRGHAGEEAQRFFCSASCLVSYMEKHHDTSFLHWVPKEELLGWKSCAWCDPGEEQERPGPFIAVDAPYGSIWDSFNGPYYFCSVPCLIAAFREDAKESGTKKWYLES